ncbi:KCNK1 [Cordylochernes scorpioides]|uniref:KCNK1 n=1 Tax=Cordylochernes scorpioides TaxID=51811 RepID=A0ABY6LP37_9ARAC|nr:KCNK1 [Cordylochernes scorpioides]
MNCWIILPVVQLCVVVFFLLIPAGIFSYLEPGWDYLDSLYYCLISLTTIGLGDLIPGDSPSQRYRPLYKVCTTGYLLIGLTFMMLFLAVVNDIPQFNLSMFFLMRGESDPEKVRLHPAAFGPKYTPQVDEPAVRHVKAVPHPQSSSPEDN